MTKVIDISSKLTNERPTLMLGEGRVYPIDDRKNTILILNQKIAQSDLNDLKTLDDIFTLLLGTEAVQEINAMDLSFSDHQYIFIAAMAGALGEDFEVVEARFQAARTSS